LFASNLISAQNLSITPLTFKSPDQSYLEVHLFVLGSSVDFVPVSTDSIQKQAQVEVLMLLRKDTNIVCFEKYMLSSPVAENPVNFVDLKRFGVENGEYELEVQVKDVNQFKVPVVSKEMVIVNFPSDSLNISDIQLIASMRKDSTGGLLNKGGFLLETLPYQFYSKETDKIYFYTELYDTDQYIGEDFAFHFRIELIYTNGRKKTMMQQTIRRKPTAILPVLMQKEIKDLPSGNYRLVVEIQDKNKTVLATKSVLFQRSNPNVTQVILRKPVKLNGKFVEKIDSQEVHYALKAMIPILASNERPYVNELIRKRKFHQQKQFLYAYWSEQNQTNPKILYAFLKYGRPNDIITVEDEPSAPPYEIWSYNSFPSTGQQNVKFLFYNPSLAVGQFQLLHSTARGEVFNAQWEVELYRDDGNGSIRSTDFDSTTVPENVARRAREYFNDF